MDQFDEQQQVDDEELMVNNIDDEKDIDAVVGPIVQEERIYKDYKESVFWKHYIKFKPTATLEMFLSDIGEPPVVLETIWNRTNLGEFFEFLHLLWFMTWIRKHTSIVSHAGEWQTSKTTFYKYVTNVLWVLADRLNEVGTQRNMKLNIYGKYPTSQSPVY
jgi:hypothetical protein